MEDFGRYRRAGVNIGIGTDVAPHNLIEEMRLAAVVTRILAEDITTTDVTAEVFRAATAGGCAACWAATISAGWHRRQSRHCTRCRPDEPVHDAGPRSDYRSLIYTAADRAIRDVYIAGTQVVRNGKILTIDHAAAPEALPDRGAATAC